MSDQLIEGLFLLAFWAPPLAVVAGALMLLVPRPVERTAVYPHPSAVAH
jgi:hypothetical protein